MFALMAPVLFLVEKEGVWRSLRSALTLGFVRAASRSKLSVAMLLISVGIIAFLSERCLQQILYYFLHLDFELGHSRQLWLVEVPFLSVTWMQMFAVWWELLCKSFAAGFFAVFMVSLYFLASEEPEREAPE